MYVAQMLGTVREKSLGLLTLEPKMADGTPVEDFDDCVLYDADGGEIKEWYALAGYLRSFGEEGIQGYGSPAGDGRKTVSHSWNPAELLSRPGMTTWAALGAAAALLLLAVFVARRVIRRRRSRRSPARE